MHNFWTILFALSAAAWIIQSIRTAWGMLRVPWLADSAPARDDAAPSISVIFAARDEAHTLPEALPTLLSQDYPRLEVIAVNDRSRDATGTILRDLERTSNRLKVLDVSELPPGWMGKPHALWRGAAAATGKWLLFTDADVHFEPGTLRRSIRLAQDRGCDHLTLLSGFDMRGFWEIVLLTYFIVGFVFGNEPWNVANRKSRRYAGVGAFQMIRRSTYDAVGGHKAVAMEVVEDMKLGKLVKLGGFSSMLGFAPDFVWLRWYSGLGNITRGLTKNMFAAMGFSAPFALLTICMVFGSGVLPFLGVLLGTGWVRIFAGVTFALAVGFQAGVAVQAKVSPLYGLTQPLGACIFIYVIARSMVITLVRGGIVWRGTFYALEDLRRGLV
jgi:hypothetical protein